LTQSIGYDLDRAVSKQELVNALASITSDINDHGRSGQMARWPVHGACPRRALSSQGKIEHWHQTFKNRILLETYYLLRDLEREIEEAP
jgi:hypothetical protein